jgi:hypothetical protein
MKIHVVSTSYNSNKYAVNNINSVYTQNFKPASHVYLDDMSIDNSVEILKEIQDSNAFKTINRVYNLTIIVNQKKKFKIKNLHELISDTSKYKDDDIICVLDGDDWLNNKNTLQEIYDLYKEKDLDYLYTNWVYSHNGQLGISKQIPTIDWDPYKSSWITSALSTFRVKRFREINFKNFLNDSGEYFVMGCDQAYVLPILEMSRRRNGNYDKVYFLNKPYYTYQFLENSSKPRSGNTGNKMAHDAHNAVTIIRKRGLIE